MYDYLQGQLVKITAKFIVLDVAGVGYLINVANPYAFSGQLNQATKIYIHQVVREDAHTLYGFKDEEEKALFLNLISVSGIGPTSALAIIAADDNAGLIRAIDEKNITYLTKFPKIGRKTAQQMVLDLEGKITSGADNDVAQTVVATPSSNEALDEAMEAMEALGYKARELKKVKTFFEGTNDTAENYIKQALKMLMK
ncbi:Holliday junction branch migration protein RuvA [Streptococcus merionis]|uniref:Holliday junction branch migration protein RuvA n=1 Tax=Streptococcus merionis TaxID=400065 RepID=UPI0026F3729A|nr:Holliday junction branch migration protein RuvA [Streptococcus merionis]